MALPAPTSSPRQRSWHGISSRSRRSSKWPLLQVTLSLGVVLPHLASAFQAGTCPPTGIAAVTNFNKATSPFDCLVYPAMNSFWPTGAWTLEGWYYIDAASRSDCCGSSYAFDVHDSSTGFLFGHAHHADYILHYIGNHVGGGSAGNLNRGEWYHIALASEGSSTVSIYHDGSYVDTLVRTVSTNSAPMHIGCRSDDLADGHGWIGRLSDFRLWNVLLTESEIQANMLQGGAISDTRLKHRWTLSNTFTDAVGSVDSPSVSGSPSFISCPELTTPPPAPTTTPDPTTPPPTEPATTYPPPFTSLQLQHDNSALSFGTPEDAFIYRVGPETLAVPGKLIVEGIDVGACCSAGNALLSAQGNANEAGTGGVSLLGNEVEELRAQLKQLRDQMAEMQVRLR